MKKEKTVSITEDKKKERKFPTDNDLAILEYLRLNPQNTRTVVAEKTTLPPSSVSMSVSFMLDKRLLEESNDGSLRVKGDRAVTIGCSIGKISTFICCVGFNYDILPLDRITELMGASAFGEGTFWQKSGFRPVKGADACWFAPTKRDSITDIQDLLNGLAEFALVLNEKIGVLGIGLAFGDLVNPRDNQIVESRLVRDVSEIDRKMLFSSALMSRMKDAGISVYLDHNAQTAALAEKYKGALVDLSNLSGLCWYLGSGLGSALIQQGVLSRITGSGFGHFNVARPEDGQGNKLTTCPCGQNGCLEEMLRQAFSKANCDMREKSAEELAECLRTNPECKERVLTLLTRAAANACALLSPDYILMTGRLAPLCSVLEMPLKVRLAQIIERQSPQILQSPLGETASSLGAAISCVERLMQEKPDRLINS